MPAKRADLTTPQHSPVFVPDVPPEPKPLCCRLQGLEVTASRSPTPFTPGPMKRGISGGDLTIKFDHRIYGSVRVAADRRAAGVERVEHGYLRHAKA